MYYPNTRSFIACQLMLCDTNTKFLYNTFEKVQEKKGQEDNLGKKEYYDFMKIKMYDGIIHGRQAYELVTKVYGCTDERVTPDNILVLKVVSNKFERIFLFPKDESKDNYKKEPPLKEGEKR
jgi:hypothetical protein